MIKKSIILSIKLLIGTIIFAGLIISGAVIFYLKGVPYLASNDKVVNYLEDVASKSLGTEIDIKHPVVKTELSPNIYFGVDNFEVLKNKKSIAKVENFGINLSLSEILKKNVILKSATSDYIFADVNQILDLQCFKAQKKSQKNDWDFDIFQSVLSIKNAKILYNLDKNTNIIIDGNNLRIDDDIDKKHVNYNVVATIKKGKNVLKIKTSDDNKVYLLDKEKFVVENSQISVNDKKLFFSGNVDTKSNYNISLSAKKFSIPYVLDFLNSQIVENNINEQLVYFKNIDGNFDFKVNVKNNNIDGLIDLNKLSFKLIPFMDLPILLNKGQVKIDNYRIQLKDFKGYYANKPSNKMDFEGSVKDYLKSMDTNLVGNAVVTNDFSEHYMSKMIGYPMKMSGKADTRVMLKMINNKIDLTWLYKFDKGNGFIVDGDETFMNDLATRVLVAKMHFENMLLNIKSIDYYAENPDKNHGNKKRIPLVSFSSNIDFSNGKTFVKDFGMNLPKPMPSGFVNMLIKEKLFKGGTFIGHVKLINTGKYPTLQGNMKVSDVRIPSQRLYIKEGEFKTDNDHMHISSNGRYRRSSYHASGVIMNEIKFPIIVKDAELGVDNIDVEKYLQIFNNQTPSDVASDNVQKTVEESIAKNVSDDDDDNSQTFDLANLIIEKCRLIADKGFYKDIKFSNVVANLTLDENSVLKIDSNKFNIADGTSSAKINCDLKKHKYSLWLALVKVDSDIIASSLLNLPKEINGKASGLMELETDDSLKLNGRIQFRVYEGIIPKIGLVEYTMKVAALFRNPLTMVTPSIVSDLVSVPEGKFEQIDGDLRLKDNVIKPMMIKSSSPQLSSFIVGTYDLEAQDAALRIYTKFSNRKKGIYGFLRNLSLNSLANRIPLSSRTDSDYYSAEISQLPKIDAEEKDCQIFLTKVDGDIVQNNFLSSLKKIK